MTWFEKVIRTNVLASSAAYQMFGQIREKVSVKSITDSKVQIEMQWEPELVLQISDQVQRLLISSEDQERVIKYYLLINDIVTTLPSDTRAISLTALLAPMFDAAYKNSIVNDDPVGENRALFQTLASLPARMTKYFELRGQLQTWLKLKQFLQTISVRQYNTVCLTGNYGPSGQRQLTEYIRLDRVCSGMTHFLKFKRAYFSRESLTCIDLRLLLLR